MATAIAACSHGGKDSIANTCGILADPPAPKKAAIDEANCPAATEVYLSAVFSDGKPVGVGGGTPAGTGNKNDKKVRGGQNICWVATDKSGGPSEQQFDIVFSPSQKVNLKQNYQSINIHPQFPTGIEFKYTVWAGEKACEFFDPRFLIN
jgi:hypothetical protein